MTTETVENKHTAIELINAWLVGAGFSAFKFDTAFSLYFYRGEIATYHGNRLPRTMELHLLGDWWLGTLSEWNEKVKKLGCGIEPEEPVKAYELAALRWSVGANVRELLLGDDILQIVFENTLRLSINTKVEDEYAFTLNESNIHADANDSSRCVTCSNGNFYYSGE